LLNIASGDAGESGMDSATDTVPGAAHTVAVESAVMRTSVH
jgi:hypothetical protein